MDNAGKILLKNLLSNMQINVKYTDYTKCWPDWRELDYVPDYSKFYFILDGEGWLRIDGVDYYPDAGQLFLMPAGIMQSYGTISENTFLKYWCHFTANVGDVEIFKIINTPCFIEVKDIMYVSDLFKKMIDSFRQDDPCSLLHTKSAMYEIIAYYLEQVPLENIKNIDSQSSEKLKTILIYIENNISKDITIEELSKLLYLHPNYFIRLFKKHMGSSPKQYINRVRLEKACQLLSSTNIPIKEIALENGFKDLFYFSKNIKSHTGLSPTEYRNLRNR
jgi:AraC-type DNA-binding domain-containing proteins